MHDISARLLSEVIVHGLGGSPCTPITISQCRYFLVALVQLSRKIMSTAIVFIPKVPRLLHRFLAPSAQSVKSEKQLPIIPVWTINFDSVTREQHWNVFLICILQGERLEPDDNFTDWLSRQHQFGRYNIPSPIKDLLHENHKRYRRSTGRCSTASRLIIPVMMQSSVISCQFQTCRPTGKCTYRSWFNLNFVFATNFTITVVHY
jgi:hypothetical protein